MSTLKEIRKLEEERAEVLDKILSVKLMVSVRVTAGAVAERAIPSGV